MAAFAEGPIDFYKSQIQVQIIRSKSDPKYKREAGTQRAFCVALLSAWGHQAWHTVVTHTLPLRLPRAAVASRHHAFALNQRCSRLAWC